jgi:Mor family transcriptional regulator
MIDPELLVELTIEDIPHGDLRDIADRIGLEGFLAIYDLFGGANIYMPKEALSLFKRRMVLTLHRQHTPKELARKLDLSVNHVYRILKDERVGSLEQIPLFEEQNSASRGAA